jgi:hypothetical protein
VGIGVDDRAGANVNLILEEDARITEAIRQHARDQKNMQREELLAAVQQSLKNKVRGLDDDNWMYEKEDDF